MFIKLIKIANCVCGRICDVAVVRAPQQHHNRCVRVRPHTQFVILINFMNFLTNFNLITRTYQYIHK